MKKQRLSPLHASLKKIILQSILPVIVIFSILFWLLGSQHGLQSTVRIAKIFLPGQLTYQSIQGTFFSPIEIKDLNYVQPKLNLSAKNIKIHFDFMDLFNNTLSLPAFHMEDGYLIVNPEYPIKIITLNGKIKFKTPGQSELIQISDFQGEMAGKPLLGTLDFLKEQQTIKNVKGSLKWDDSTFLVDNDQEGNMIWQSFFLPKKEITIKSKGIATYNPELHRLQGTIQDISLTSEYTDDWQLKNPSDFILSDHNFSVLPLYFTNSKNTELYIQMSWDKEKGKAIQINIPDFNFHSDEIKGNFTLDLALKGASNEPLHGKGSINIKPGRAKFYLNSHQYYQTNYRGGTIHLDLQKEGLNVNLNFTETPRNTLTAQLLIPDFSVKKPLEEQKLQGQFNGRIQDVSIFYLLAPYISRLKAILDFSGEFEGSLANPLLKIRGQLHDTIFSVPKQHITFKSVKADIQGTLPGTLNINSSGTLGGNPFYIQGNTEIKQNGVSQFDITGDKIRIYNTADLHIIATPNLKLTILDGNLYLVGNLLIDEANILQKEELRAINTSHDIVFIGKDRDHLMEKLSFQPNIEINIPKESKVHYKGHGLEAFLRGKLKIERRPDGLFTGTGRLSIREGKYRLQGNHYQINRGLLLYTPGTLLNDPLLEIRIFKRRAGQIEEATEVGIYVQGTLQSPTYQFYSTNDDIQSSEIISRLGFGANNTEEGEEKQKLLAQTAQLLAEGANPVVERLQNKLALEEFGIQSAESQKIISNQGGYDTVLVVGKALTKKIYLQFIQGMMEPLSMIRLKYFFSPRFAVGVESSTAEDIGGDFSFSMERN